MAETHDSPRTGGAFEHVELPPAQVPDFYDPVIEELVDGTDAGDIVVDGVEIAVAQGVRFAMLAAYDPHDDPQAAALTSEQPPSGCATAALAWTQEVQAEMGRQWGEPEIHVLELVADGDEHVPASPLDAVLASVNIHQAEIWHDGLRQIGLVTGWSGEPGLSRLVQLALWLGYEPQHEPSTEPSWPLTFHAQGAASREVSVTDARQAYAAFEAYFTEHGPGTSSRIDRPQDRQCLLLDPVALVMTRVDQGDNPRTQYLKLDRASECTSAAVRFLTEGYDGMSTYGSWVDDRTVLGGDPAALGQARAAAVTSDEQAYEVVCQLWADSGIEDRTGEFLVFFEGRRVADEPAERAELLVLIDRLGLDRVELPEGARDGEVWVRYNDVLRGEIGNWS